jgi:hypothetical protein
MLAATLYQENPDMKRMLLNIESIKDMHI